MSWETTEWANRQRMKDAQTQIVLLVLANCADPSGVAFTWRKSTKHWDQYLIDRTRLSRATVFRKIKELKDLGLADPQLIIHDDGRKQYVVELALTRFAEWVDGANGEEGHYVVRASNEVISPDQTPPAEHESGALDDAIMAHDFQSHSETEKLARGVFRHADESQAETGIESRAETQQTAAAPPESHPETNRVSVVRLQETPLQESPKKDSPPTPSGAPIGFNALKRDYPQSEVIPLWVWEKAADEFAKLSSTSQTKAMEAASRYKATILKFNRKPINPDKWLRKREFERYSASAALSIGTPRIFRAEGTEPWEAWCNVLGILYGDPSRIPKSHDARGPRGERGIIVPAEWPLGGAGWLVPRERWCFVEQYTPNFNRFNERISEIFGRSLNTIRASGVIVKPHHKIIGRGPDGALSVRDALGALVPGEWPPPKGDQSTVTVSDDLRQSLAS
jgi:hypothetical protein